MNSDNNQQGICCDDNKICARACPKSLIDTTYLWGCSAGSRMPSSLVLSATSCVRAHTIALSHRTPTPIRNPSVISSVKRKRTHFTPVYT